MSLKHSRKQNPPQGGCSNGDGNDTRINRVTIRQWLIVLALIAGPLLLSGCGVAFASPASDARQQAATEMLHYKAAHPECEACGTRGMPFARPNEVHHIITVSVAPDKASDTNNMITLCRPCHIVLGHCGDGACRKYCPNIREVLAIRIVKENRP